MLKPAGVKLEPIQEAVMNLLTLPCDDIQAQANNLNPMDWERLVALGTRQKILPYLYGKIKNCGSFIPSEIFEKFQEGYFRSSVRNLMIDHELGQILKRFIASGVEVLLLKGVYLANAAYTDPGLRPMADIDLMIQKADIPAAIRLLEQIGFIADRPFWMDVDGDLHYHAPVMSRNGVLVELHWSLTRETNLDSIDVAGLWQRSIPVDLAQGQARALGLSDLILHLAVHIAYGHRFHHQLQSLIDLDTVTRKFQEQIDWDEIGGLCKQWRAERGTALAFRLGQQLFASPIPEEIIESLMPADWDEGLLNKAVIAIFQEEPVLSENYERLVNGATIAEKIRGLLIGLFPSRGVMAMQYGLPLRSWKIVFLYPHYAANRVRKYWRFAWKRMRGDELQEKESRNAKDLRTWLGI